MSDSARAPGPADLIAGRWRPLAQGTAALRSFNPAVPSEEIWAGAPVPAHVDEAVVAARGALPQWATWAMERRADVLKKFQVICVTRQADIAALVRRETGKVDWDAKGEAGLLGAKVDITLDAGEHGALRRVSGFTVPLTPASRHGEAWFRPHGVLAVLGPFNFPMHLPNGHIVPALLLGNTIVFKPSDKAPACGQLLAELFHEALIEAGAPPGVLNLVQGGVPAAQALVRHADLDGILFTGSWPVGRAILEANLDRPGRICALEMGGNNAAIIMPDADLKQAVIECVRCAYITSGQRCTCTRRVIVHRDIADRVLPALIKATRALTIGSPEAAPAVFMGPVISRGSRDAVLQAQETFIRAGAKPWVEGRALELPGGGWYLSPSLLQVARFNPTDAWGDAGCDREVFGPLLRVAIADSFEDAITQANATGYGLAASLFTKDSKFIARFRFEARAGCININTGTAGASSKLPFGGLGFSGNHRPAGAFSVDYCAYPVAGMIEAGSASTLAAGMTFDDSWLS